MNLIIPGDMKMLTLCEVEVYREGLTMSHIFANKTLRSINMCIIKSNSTNSFYMYLCLVPVLKRSFVKMQFNSRVDLTDPSVRENVLKQVRQRNKFNCHYHCVVISVGAASVVLSWSTWPFVLTARHVLSVFVVYTPAPLVILFDNSPSSHALSLSSLYHALVFAVLCQSGVCYSEAQIILLPVV